MDKSYSYNVSLDQWLVHGVSNAVAALVCLLAAVLVFALKLYNKVVYRLALYQVLASFALASATVIQTLFINYDDDPEVYGHVCTFMGWVAVYCQWLKLLFTAWVAFHLFYFSVFNRNLKRFELLYIATSLLVPAAIASLPLVIVTNTYGPAPLGGCYILGTIGDAHSQYVALVERLALWDVPAMVVLFAASSAMVVVVITFSCAAWRLQRGDGDAVRLPAGGGQQLRALKQLIPLAAFPLVFFALKIPELVLDVYVSKASGSSDTEGLVYSSTVFISLWSTTSGITLLIHIVVAKYLHYRKKHQGPILRVPLERDCAAVAAEVISESTTVRLSSIKKAAYSATYYSLPPDETLR